MTTRHHPDPKHAGCFCFVVRAEIRTGLCVPWQVLRVTSLCWSKLNLRLSSYEVVLSTAGFERWQWEDLGSTDRDEKEVASSCLLFGGVCSNEQLLSREGRVPRA